VIQLVLGVALGVLLHQVETLKGLVRTVMVSPFMLPPVVVGMMSIVVLDPAWASPTTCSRASACRPACSWRRTTS
jgi:ABC-type sugar transport system permease subunit